MANKELKAKREAYRKDKKRNPFGLYIEDYTEWLVDIPAKVADAIIANDEIRIRSRADYLQYTDIGYLVKFIVNGDDFTEILKFLKSNNVKGKYCTNDPCYSWKDI